MRDSHHLKEKYELSLDSSQVVTLTVAALVVLGGVFVLGVVVGKKLALEPAAKPETDLLSSLDEKTRALDTAKRDASLTFQEELTKELPRAASAPDAGRIAELKPSEQKQTMAKLAEAKLAEAKLAEAKLAEAKLAEAKLAEAKLAKVADAKLAEAKAAEAKATEAKKESSAARVGGPNLPETIKDTAVATRTHDGGAMKEAFGRVSKLPEGADDSNWTLQMAAYQDRAEAERFAAGLRDKGYAPYLVSAELPGRGTWHRVRVGRFASKELAARYQSDFRRETQLTSIVTTVR